VDGDFGVFTAGVLLRSQLVSESRNIIGVSPKKVVKGAVHYAV
jgi:hypothetical protein